MVKKQEKSEKLRPLNQPNTAFDRPNTGMEPSAHLPIYENPIVKAALERNRAALIAKDPTVRRERARPVQPSKTAVPPASSQQKFYARTSLDAHPAPHKKDGPSGEAPRRESSRMLSQQTLYTYSGEYVGKVIQYEIENAQPIPPLSPSQQAKSEKKKDTSSSKTADRQTKETPEPPVQKSVPKPSSKTAPRRKSEEAIVEEPHTPLIPNRGVPLGGVLRMTRTREGMKFEVIPPEN